MNWLYLPIWTAIALVLFTYGLKSKSQLSMFFGTVIFIAPILYFSGIQSLVFLLPLVPAVSLAVSYIAKKKLDTA